MCSAQWLARHCVLDYYGAFRSKWSQRLVYTQQPKTQSVQQNALNIRYVLSQGIDSLKSSLLALTVRV